MPNPSDGIEAYQYCRRDKSHICGGFCTFARLHCQVARRIARTGWRSLLIESGEIPMADQVECFSSTRDSGQGDEKQVDMCPAREPCRYLAV